MTTHNDESPEVTTGTIDFMELKVGTIQSASNKAIAYTPNLDRLMQIPDPTPFVQPRLTLSDEVRKKLLEVLPVEMLTTSEWHAVEDVLTESLAPPRYITGVAQPAPWLSDPHAP